MVKICPDCMEIESLAAFAKARVASLAISMFDGLNVAQAVLRLSLRSMLLCEPTRKGGT